MKLKRIEHIENGTQSPSVVDIELKPDDLSVEAFANLRHLIDETNLMEHDQVVEGSPIGDYEVVFIIETTDGNIHKAVFRDTEMPPEYQELADYIKEIGKTGSVPMTPHSYIDITPR